LYEQINHHRDLGHVVIEINISLKYDPMTANKIFLHIIIILVNFKY
jgi:hypothetical protein